MADLREKANAIKIVVGDVWVSEGGNTLEIIAYSEKHKIVTYRINKFLEDREAPSSQIQMGIIKANAKIKKD